MRWLTILGVATAIAGCGEVWNDPYPAVGPRARTSSTARSRSGRSISIRCSPTARTRLVQRADLRAAAAVPLPEATLRADPPHRRVGSASALSGCRRKRGAGRVAGGRVQRVRDPHQAGHPLSAAPGLRARSGRQPHVPRPDSRGPGPDLRSRTSRKPGRASSSPTTTSTRSSGSPTRGCIRRSSA